MFGRLGALCFVALAWAGLVTCGPGGARRPNIVLVVLDTVRADRIGCYGYPRPTTPRIDSLCQRAIRFANVSSTSAWTLPAHASLFTGLFPIQHGATQEHTSLDSGAPTLAEILGAHGYATFGVSANPMVSVKSGLARGFDEFAETWRGRRETSSPEPRAHPNVRAVDRLLGGLDRDRPFFLFVNYIEAHGPYDPPEPYRSRLLSAGAEPALVAAATRRGAAEYYLDPASISAAEFRILNDLYDGEIAYVDDLVGGLIEHLEARGHLDDTLLILTSDHGENIGDHGHFRHVFNLYGSSVRVPLIVLLPGAQRAAELRREPAGLVDVFATILAAAGVTPPAGSLQGRDLLGERNGGEEFPVVSEYYFPLQALRLFDPDAWEEQRQALAPYLRRLRSVEMGGLRLIWSSDGRHELFDLSRDPGERENLHGDPRVSQREKRLHAQLEAFVERGGGSRPLPAEARRNAAPEGAFAELDPESAALLQELGYLPR